MFMHLTQMAHGWCTLGKNSLPGGLQALWGAVVTVTEAQNPQTSICAFPEQGSWVHRAAFVAEAATADSTYWEDWEES